MDYPNSSPRVPVISNNLKVGARANILGLIRITDDVVIGANALVFVDKPNDRDAR